MPALIGQIASLLKLRIGIAIAASALAGMAATEGQSLAYWQVAGFALAVLGGAGAAGAFNHYFERDLDIRMQRTAHRPFAAGRLHANAWWIVSFVLLFVASFALAVATGGMIAALYVFLGAFVYGVVYTVWLKRRTAWNIVVGGLAGSFAVLAGAAAVSPTLQAGPVVLALVLFLWTPPHFWSLAAARRDEYAAAGYPMLPVIVSERAWSAAILTHTAALTVLSLVPLACGFGWAYGIGAFTGGAYFLWCSWELYRRPTRASAMRNFGASLIQLTLLIAGVVVDAAIR